MNTILRDPNPLISFSCQIYHPKKDQRGEGIECGFE